MSGPQPLPRRDSPATAAEADDQSRATSAVAAAFLAQGRLIGRLSLPLTAGAILLLVALAVFGPTPPATTTIALLAAIVLGIVERYFAFRVGFDAALFARLADHDRSNALSRLDRALIDLKLLPKEKAGRPFEDRFVGGRKLLLRQAAAALLQVFCLIGAAAATAL